MIALRGIVGPADPPEAAVVVLKGGTRIYVTPSEAKSVHAEWMRWEATLVKEHDTP